MRRKYASRLCEKKLNVWKFCYLMIQNTEDQSNDKVSEVNMCLGHCRQEKHALTRKPTTTKL